MIINFKLFESLEEVDLQNKFANIIVDLYESENIAAQNDYSEDEYGVTASFCFRIFYKSRILIDIEYFQEELELSVTCDQQRKGNIEKFIKDVLSEFDEASYFTNCWSFNAIKLKDLPEIMSKLSVDNFEMWKDSIKYNL